MLSSVQKIASQHLERLAVIYLRQSSPKQVRENFRSTERQYGLAEEAARLQLGAVPRKRAAPRREQQPQRSAPAARGSGAVPGDLALRRVRRVDDHPAPPRGQLLRMRPLPR